jgi:hypothetical protein
MPSRSAERKTLLQEDKVVAVDDFAAELGRQIVRLAAQQGR